MLLWRFMILKIKLGKSAGHEVNTVDKHRFFMEFVKLFRSSKPKNKRKEAEDKNKLMWLMLVVCENHRLQPRCCHVSPLVNQRPTVIYVMVSTHSSRFAPGEKTVLILCLLRSRNALKLGQVEPSSDSGKGLLEEHTAATPQRLNHLPSMFILSLQKYLYTCNLCLCRMLYLKTDVTVFVNLISSQVSGQSLRLNYPTQRC